MLCGSTTRRRRQTTQGLRRHTDPVDTSPSKPPALHVPASVSAASDHVETHQLPGEMSPPWALSDLWCVRPILVPDWPAPGVARELRQRPEPELPGADLLREHDAICR